MKRPSVLTKLLFGIGSLSILVLWNNCGKGFVAIEPTTIGQLNQSSLSATAKGEKLYQANCFGCHGSLDTSTKTGRTPQQISDALRLIPQMSNLRAQLSSDDLTLISGALKPTQCTNVPIGHTPLQRLNRPEYTNSVRAIFQITSSPGENLPQEPLYHEFSNLGDKQAVNQELADAYLAVAKTVVDEAVQGARANIFVCTQQTDTCARQIISRLAEKAYRRMPTNDEINALMALRTVATQQGEGFEAGIKLSLQGLLVSPQFLYRFIEHTSGRVQLDPFELATRLAYFLWSSPPDDTLINLAKSGQLSNETVLREQVVRMLQDAKATALVDQFAMQWLRLHQLKVSSVSRPAYPIYDNAFKDQLIEESRQLVLHVFKNDLSPLEIFDANYTFVNATLASFYGIPNVTGTNFRKVDLPANLNRQGILSHASVMSMTSKPAETSIVHRGVWVLSHLLCDQPEPPPPDISQSEMLSELERSRDRLKNPDCAKCHVAIDNIGVGFESFGPIGQWRTNDSKGQPLQISGTLIGSGTYSSTAQLIDFVAADKRVPYCMTRKLMTYAIGREISSAQRCAVREIADKNVTKASRFSDLVLAIVQSEFFRYQADGGQ